MHIIAENVENFKELLPSVSVASGGWLPNIESPPLRGILLKTHVSIRLFLPTALQLFYRL